MLRLVDLIRLSGVDIQNYKIHCATDNKASGWQPLVQYFAGTFEEGQSLQTQKNFECEYVLSLINLGTSKSWLFVGVYEVYGAKQTKLFGGYTYDLRRIGGLEHLEGGPSLTSQNSFGRRIWLARHMNITCWFRAFAKSECPSRSFLGSMACV